jgi:hypothetical protein
MFYENLSFLHDLPEGKRPFLLASLVSELLIMYCFSELIVPIVVQEIMFEPKVMCEPVDKKLTFSENKV